MEDPQAPAPTPAISPLTIISESDMKKMESENELTVNNIQQLIRHRLGRQREQIMNKKSALQRMNEMASQLPVELSSPRPMRESVSPGTPEELASCRQDQQAKPVPEKKESSDTSLSVDMIKKGLKCHGYHPFLLRHTFLQLEVPSSDLKNVDSLAGYENLMYINVADNSIEDLSVLSKFPSILQLNARYTKYKYDYIFFCFSYLIQALGVSLALFFYIVICSGNELTTCLDFAPPYCNQKDAWSTGHIALGSILVNADISQNHIVALGSLSRHPFLECLLASHNLIRKIEGLSSLSFLQVLDLSDNDINVIQGLDNLPIRELNLSGNNLLTLHGLDKLPELAFLNVSRNKITCLAPLKKCTMLSYLDAQHNDLIIIRQVEFLKDLEWLRYLILMGNPASYIPFYRNCVIHIIPLIQFLDRSTVSVEEKIKSANMFKDEFNDVASRQVVFEKYFPGEVFRNFGPVFVDDESGINLDDLEEADNKLEELIRE